MLANMNPELWSAGSIPAVNAKDVEILLDKRRQFLKEIGDQPTVVDPHIFAQACEPDTDVMAAWYRTSILALLQRGGLLPSDLSDEAKSVVFEIVATFPMKQMEIGKVYHGLPADLQELATKIKQQLDLLGQRAQPS